MPTRSRPRPAPPRPPTSAAAPPAPTQTGSSRSLGKFFELGAPTLEVRVLALLRLFAHVVEESRVARELLNTGETIVGSVHRRLQHAQRERTVLEHRATPAHGLDLEIRERNHGVHQPHVERLVRVVLT